MDPGARRIIMKKGTIILAFPDDAEGERDAKAWLRSQGYKPPDVYLWRSKGQILGKLLRDV